jgi:hypothetical protein
MRPIPAKPELLKQLKTFSFCQLFGLEMNAIESMMTHGTHAAMQLHWRLVQIMHVHHLA